MDWYVYMLRCEDGSLYTGIASDVEKRFAMHKGAALRREAAIKKLPRAKKLELTEENCDA